MALVKPVRRLLTDFAPRPSPHWPDGWAFTNNFDINQHQSLEDRLSAARILLKKDPLCPVVVDDMSDTSAIKYGALPERLYVLQAGKVIYKVRGRSTRLPRASAFTGLLAAVHIYSVIDGKSLRASSVCCHECSASPPALSAD